METTNLKRSKEDLQHQISEQIKPEVAINTVMQYLELEEEEISYSLQVARLCIC